MTQHLQLLLTLEVRETLPTHPGSWHPCASLQDWGGPTPEAAPSFRAGGGLDRAPRTSITLRTQEGLSGPLHKAGKAPELPPGRVQASPAPICQALVSRGPDAPSPPLAPPPAPAEGVSELLRSQGLGTDPSRERSGQRVTTWYPPQREL